MVKATANPRVVAIPTPLFAFSNASGIMVVASIVRIAPAREAQNKGEGVAGSALEDRQADHERFRDAVEHGAQHDGERRGIGLLSGGVFPLASAELVDEKVAAEEHQAAYEQARNCPAGTRRHLSRFLDQVERDGE